MLSADGEHPPPQPWARPWTPTAASSCRSWLCACYSPWPARSVCHTVHPSRGIQTPEGTQRNAAFKDQLKGIKQQQLSPESWLQCITGMMRSWILKETWFELTASMSLASSNSRAMVSPAAILMLTSSLSSNRGSLGRCLQNKVHALETLLKVYIPPETVIAFLRCSKLNRKSPTACLTCAGCLWAGWQCRWWATGPRTAERWCGAGLSGGWSKDRCHPPSHRTGWTGSQSTPW